MGYLASLSCRTGSPGQAATGDSVDLEKFDPNVIFSSDGLVSFELMFPPAPDGLCAPKAAIRPNNRRSCRSISVYTGPIQSLISR